MNKALEEVLNRLNNISYRIDDSATLSSRDVVNIEDIEEIIQGVAKEYNGGWVPVSKGLPKAYGNVYVTCHSLCDSRPDWVALTFYTIDGFNIPLVDLGQAEVVAWKEYKEPDVYMGK